MHRRSLSCESSHHSARGRGWSAPNLRGRNGVSSRAKPDTYNNCAGHTAFLNSTAHRRRTPSYGSLITYNCYGPLCGPEHRSARTGRHAYFNTYFLNV